MSEKTRLVIGSDILGSILRKPLIEYIQQTYSTNIILYDAGDDNEQMYPKVAYKVAKWIQEGKFDRGVLICGTGIGMSITANKVKGIYAALVWDPYSAERAQKSNKAQIITFGAQVMGLETAKKLLDIWLNSYYVSGGRSEPKLQIISDIEQKEFK